MGKNACYRIALMYFESCCKHCGGVASAVIECHSDVFVKVALFWECKEECYHALSPLEQHNGQVMNSPEDLHVFFKRGYIVEILRDGSLVTHEASFSEALRLEKQESAPVWFHLAG